MRTILIIILIILIFSSCISLKKNEVLVQKYENQRELISELKSQLNNNYTKLNSETSQLETKSIFYLDWPDNNSAMLSSKQRKRIDSIFGTSLDKTGNYSVKLDFYNSAKNSTHHSLNERRNSSLTQYLINKGYNPSQIYTLGYGESELRNQNNKYNFNFSLDNDKTIMDISQMFEIVKAEEVEIAYDENFVSGYEPAMAKSIDLSKYEDATDIYTANLKLLNNNSETIWTDLLNEKFVAEFTDMECWDKRPKDIHALTDGVLIDAYSFEKGDEVKLGLLGFLNINIKQNQKIVVVEFSQEGTQYCKEKSYKYGIGARLMLKVNKSKKSAKLNTPQQITASVIFGKAEVTYSLKTFGIVGKGIAELNKTGALSEDTYQEFLQGISHLIVEMYKEESEFVITPQPLFIWNEK